jgi:ferric-dicitrate binding protein FerR (iron transport regulator)
VTADTRLSPVRRRASIALVGFALVATTVVVGVWYEVARAPAPNVSTATSTTVAIELAPDGSTPVWVQAMAGGADASLVFTIGPWRRTVSVPPGTTTFGFSPPVDLADPQPPLVVEAAGVTVEVGFGRVPESVLVNDGWSFSPRAG